ncbi:hypothetical protein BT69DRAFT_350757 [Atractiella rhizophila]|nr:hypothetical protein BT69DRAFT_350757 [Atractiella rhizophila]
MIVDGVQCQCEILDTAGTEQFLALHTLYMKSGDGFVLVFALNSMDSIKELQPIRENILRQKDNLGIEKSKVPFVLIGNKCDLVAERTVQREVGVALSRLWGGVPYYEASARREINVNALFEDIVRQVVKLDQEANPQSNYNAPSKRRKRAKASCVII